MPGVFISYRRHDCPGHAGRLYDRLVERFGAPHVFMDIDAIEPGVDFGERIEQAVGSCDVLLALIGREWAGASDASGRRRLDDADDFVRLELAAGLERGELRVIPVLVEGASMPGADDLPDELKPLARRNAFELSDARWQYDVTRLAEVVGRVIRPPAEKRQKRLRASTRDGRRLPPLALVTGVAIVVATVAGGVALLAGGDGGGGADRGKKVVGPVAVGREAGRLAFGAGSVWVPLGAQSAVARVDPSTLKFRLTKGVGDYPASVASGEGAIWVADSGGDTVTRIDARTGALSDSIPVGDEPNDIAAGEGFVWTANCACTPPSSSRFSVSRIDPRTRQATRIGVPGTPLGIGTGDGSVWVTNDTDGTVQRIDPRAAQLVGEPIRVGANPTDVAVDRTGIWVALAGDNSVVRIDPRTLRRGDRIPVGESPTTLALGGGFLWIAHDRDGSLWRVDTRLRRVVDTPLSVGRVAAGVAFGDGRAWVDDFKSGELRGVAP